LQKKKKKKREKERKKERKKEEEEDPNPKFGNQKKNKYPLLRFTYILVKTNKTQQFNRY
jgi:ABC-type phosphate transport system substrate-binding protein